MTRKRARLLLALAVLLTTASSASAAVNSWTQWSVSDAAFTAVPVRGFGIDGGTLYAASDNGVLRSTNGGITWQPFSAGLAGNSLKVRSVTAVPGGVLAATAAGVFRLADTTWQATSLAQPTRALAAVGSAVLAGVDGAGVHRSTDGGVTWTAPAPGNGMASGETTSALVPHPVTAGVVLAATQSGVFRSNDAGVGWSAINDGIPTGLTIGDVAVHAGAPDTYVAITAAGAYRTTDAGVTWAPVLSGLSSSPSSLYLHSAADAYVATVAGLYKTGDLSNPDPLAVRWLPVTDTGLPGAPELVSIADGFPTANTVFAGAPANGAYHLTTQPPGNSSAPTMSGTFQAGKKITASAGVWAGTPDFAYSYQWQFCPGGANCADLPGETDAEYLVRFIDAGDNVRVIVTAQNPAPGSGVSVPSALSPVVTANPGSLPTGGTPTITDGELPFVGGTLTANPPSGWGNGGSTTGYRWTRCDSTGNSCQPIPGARSATYVLGEPDVGRRLRLQALGTNSAGSVYGGSSGSTGIVSTAPAQNLAKPSISGQPYPGETLVGAAGTWASYRTGFSRRWLRCDAAGAGCTALPGQTGTAYTVLEADIGHRLALEVAGDTNAANAFPPPVVVTSDPSQLVTARLIPPVLEGPGPIVPGPGGGAAPDSVKPVIRALKATAKSFKAGKTLKFRIDLSEAATLTLTIERLTNGRRKGTRCVKPTAKLRRAKKCTLATKVGKAVTRTAPAGVSTFSLKPAKKLAAGKYRLRATARDAAGNVSAAKLAAFMVKRR